MGMKSYSQFKLWMQGDVAPANRKSDLIITSHGSRTMMGGRTLMRGLKKRKVPAGMELHFYGPDRATIVSGTIKFEFIDHDLRGHVRKTKSAGERYVDYGLTKYQGRHGDEDETYDTVRECLGSYDVVTIRHRPLRLGGSINLSKLLAQLSKAGYVYEHIHCSFCRSYKSILMELLHGRANFTTPT
jgi:hypothetical protein